MYGVLDIAVANAAVAAGLALVAWAAARYVRRPALTHALCLLVLLKLVTPPLFDVPLPWPWEQPAGLPLIDWYRAAQLGVLIWVVGSICWFAIQFRLATGLRAAIRCAAPAPTHISDAAAQLAAAMGLPRHPPVRVLSATDSPMLCGFGPGACIVLPAAILDRLPPEAQGTIVAHELAHFARRDHWVRLVEVIATGCFWWHPAVWWTRRQLESAEEQCCDALVMRHCAGQQRVYAAAILDVVDWLAERRRAASPALASALSGRTSLVERLQGVLSDERPNQKHNVAGAGVAVAAALCLLVQPRFDASSPGEASPATADIGDDWSHGAKEIDGRHVEPAQVWATAVSPGGKYAVSVRRGYRCEITELATSRVHSLEAWQITCLAFLPDGDSFIVGDLRGTVRHVDAATGCEISVLGAGGVAVNSVDVSAQAERVAAADGQGRIKIIDVASQEAVSWTRGAPIRCVRFSPDGSQMAIALGTWRDSSRGGVEILDVASRQVVQRWEATQPLGALGYVSQDGLLTADWAGRVECRRISDGRLLGSVNARKDLVSAEAFSADAEALAPLARELAGLVRRDSSW
jgi:bla regulator protein BlaR1